jgi:16S rRNA (uracil1498-N3)-methyltransferase
MATPRLFVEQPLAAGAAFALAPQQAHYVTRVMRRKPGDTLRLFNGRDGEWRAEIAAARKGCSVTVTECGRPQAAGPDVWLVFAPVKRAPIDLIAEKATELGVAALCPVITRHTDARRVNLVRLRANAIEAAEQCGRLDVPDCRAPVAFGDLIAGWPAGRRVLLCDETGGGAPIAKALAEAACEPATPWAIVTGPEGGFADDEIRVLTALPGALRVGLGPRILRAETAALAALACWQAVLGDWKG